MHKFYNQGGIDYTFNDASKTWCVGGSDKNIVTANILSEIDGTPVTSIDASAFYCREKLASVFIPEPISDIGSEAFSWCKNLQSVSLPTTIINIGESVFSQCSKLEKINLPDAVATIGREAFSYCTNLKSLTIPPNANSVQDYVFLLCKNLQQVSILSNAPTKKDWFVGCNSLTTIILGQNTRDFKTPLFLGAPNLETFIVEKDNPCLCSDYQGILYTKNKSRIISIPNKNNGTLILPSTLQNLNAKTIKRIAEKYDEVVVPSNIKLKDDTLQSLETVLHKAGKRMNYAKSFEIEL